MAASSSKTVGQAAIAPRTATQAGNTPFGAWFGIGWNADYQYSAALIGSTLLLLLVFFLVTSFVVWRAGEGLSDRYMKVTLLLLVIFVALSISVSNFEEKATNAILGLIGTIAGYLLGRTDSVTAKPNPDATAKQSAGGGGPSPAAPT
jgi:hypothetical protein